MPRRELNGARGMVLLALLTASCLKLSCSSAERLAGFWHLKSGVKLHAVASQVPPETKDLGGSCPSSICPPDVNIDEY